eukprot:GCRY01005852.1.p1 GENE.GCRY01005852.1~~GCRY01005852.1.p1  ORF type:complete len:506 (-),score=83.20 GCRY01005852.1:239-1756(-)
MTLFLAYEYRALILSTLLLPLAVYYLEYGSLIQDAVEACLGAGSKIFMQLLVGGLYFLVYHQFGRLCIVELSSPFLYWLFLSCLSLCVSLTPAGVDLTSLFVFHFFYWLQIVAIVKVSARYCSFPASYCLDMIIRHQFKYSHNPLWNPFTPSLTWHILPAYCTLFASTPFVTTSTIVVVYMMLFVELRLMYEKRETNREWWKLDEYDQRVLELMAEHEQLTVEEFARTKGIKELRVVKDGTNNLQLMWRGCNHTSEPCWTHKYVGWYGLNEPPCCRAHMYQMCADVVRLLGEMGIQAFVDGGTLLGTVRHNKEFLPWDDDCDVGMILPPHMSSHMNPGNTPSWVKELKAKLAVRGYTLLVSASGYLHVVYMATPAFPFTYDILRKEVSRCMQLDLIAWQKWHGPLGEVEYCRENLLPGNKINRLTIPEDTLLPLQPLALNGREEWKVFTPNHPEGFLDVAYGNWKELQYSFFADESVGDIRRALDIQWLTRSRALATAHPNPNPN